MSKTSLKLHLLNYFIQHLENGLLLWDMEGEAEDKISLHLPSPITPEHPIPKLRVLQRAPPHTQYCAGHQQPMLQDTISLGIHSYVQTLQYFKLSHENKCQSEKKWRLVSGRKPLKCKTVWSESPVPSSLLPCSAPSQDITHCSANLRVSAHFPPLLIHIENNFIMAVFTTTKTWAFS